MLFTIVVQKYDKGRPGVQYVATAFTEAMKGFYLAKAASQREAVEDVKAQVKKQWPARDITFNEPPNFEEAIQL